MPKSTESKEVTETKVDEEAIIEKTKPVFKPSFKPKPVENKEVVVNKIEEDKIEETLKPKPVFKPSFKPKPKAEEHNNSTTQ